MILRGILYPLRPLVRALVRVLPGDPTLRRLNLRAFN